MKKAGAREVEIELTKESYEGLQKMAQKTGLPWEEVVDMILGCELDIIEYSARMRKKLAKRLKIKPTKRFLYKPRFCG